MRPRGLRLAATHSGVPFPRATESLLSSAGLLRWHYHPQDLGRKGLACKTSLLTASHKIFLKLLEDELTYLSAISSYLELDLVGILLRTQPLRESSQPVPVRPSAGCLLP